MTLPNRFYKLEQNFCGANQLYQEDNSAANQDGVQFVME